VTLRKRARRRVALPTGLLALAMALRAIAGNIVSRTFAFAALARGWSGNV
jgi:hypothetical protein